jgi:prepilin-type N-terminal cleavage/methylation domain-containing protein
MKNKKGFTLVELMAIIVILSIIVLITTPIIMNVISDSHKKTFETSVEGIYRAIHADYTQKGYTNSQSYEIDEDTITNTSDNSRTDSSFVFSGKIADGSGTATVTYDSSSGALKIILKIQNNTFCADNTSKNGRNEYVITKGACS